MCLIAADNFFQILKAENAYLMGKMCVTAQALHVWIFFNLLLRAQPTEGFHKFYIVLQNSNSLWFKTPSDTCVLTRLHCFQRCGFWRDVSCKHGNRRRLRRIHLWVPGQLQFLRGHVEAGGTDLLAGKPIQSCGRTRHPAKGGLQFYHVGEKIVTF